MTFIDTHAHIYLSDFDEDRSVMIERAIQLGVHNIYMPNIDSTSIEAIHRVEKEFPENCFAMMGLHPCYVKENYQEELTIIEHNLKNRRYSGLGEIGIDLYWDKTTLKEQEKAFRIQIQWASELDLPIIIHSRDSLDLTIGIIAEMQKGNLKGIFHCFNGTLEQAKSIKDTGFLMGIGGVVTFKKAGVDKTVAELGLDHLVLETDAPYLTPTPFRGKRNMPEYIPIIAEKVAEAQGITVEEVALKTTENATLLFLKDES